MEVPMRSLVLVGLVALLATALPALADPVVVDLGDHGVVTADASTDGAVVCASVGDDRLWLNAVAGAHDGDDDGVPEPRAGVMPGVRPPSSPCGT